MIPPGRGEDIFVRVPANLERSVLTDVPTWGNELL
jgi:hypothetical protein